MATKKSPPVEEEGIARSFKRGVGAFLRSYARNMGDGNKAEEALNRLRRFVQEGDGFEYTIHISTYQYDARMDVSDELRTLYYFSRWKAVQGALGGGQDSDWLHWWKMSVAYGYWFTRVVRFKQEIFIAKNNSTKWMYLQDTVAFLGDCLALGWLDWAVDLARVVNWGLDHTAFGDQDEEHHRRIQYFVFRLVADWQGWPARTYPDFVRDIPAYNDLLGNWRDPDPAAITPALIAACDRHTHQARYSENREYDLPDDGLTYDPFEILAVLRLRQLAGLENPVLDHPLMNTPLGKLHEPVPPVYTDELLEKVIEKMQQMFYPGLAERPT